MIVARRPDSPLLVKASSRSIAASASPKRPTSSEPEDQGPDAVAAPPPAERTETGRRTARIIQLQKADVDPVEQRRRLLLERLMLSEGRGVITRLVDDYLAEDFELPREQPVQLQVLEHFDEAVACTALEIIAELLETEPALKRPVLDQRLRRLEEHGESSTTRESAAHLRRRVRAS